MEKCVSAPVNGEHSANQAELEQAVMQRTRLLIGDAAMEALARKRVILFGVGGVGGWCAESLVRSGVKHLTLVDFDRVNLSNVNRQLVATVNTVGRAKVEVLRERLLALNPNAEIIAREEMFCEQTLAGFDLASFDYVIDAIDSLKDKALLILETYRTESVLFSSMGAALKVDASRIRVAEFWKVAGDPLARALRRTFKRSGMMPSRKFQCVYSDEVPYRLGTALGETANAEEEAQSIRKVSVNGTLAHVTAIFGFTLAGLVIQDVLRSVGK